MKHNFYRITVACLAWIMLAACSGDSTPYGESKIEEFQVEVEQSSRHLTFDTERDATVYVNAGADVSWRAHTNSTWVAIGDGKESYYSGRGAANLLISVLSDNPDKSRRTAVVHIESYRFNRYIDIEVEQEGGYITAPESVAFPAIGNTQSITVTSNVSWTLSTANSTFLQSATPREGKPGTTTISLTSKSNTKALDNEEYLWIEPVSSNVNATGIRLLREKVLLDAEIDNTWLSRSGGTFNLNIRSNSNWEITDYDSWLHPDVRSGIKDKTVKFTVYSNSGLYRNCTFCVKSGEVQVWVWVGQEGMPTPEEGDNVTPRYNRKR